MDRSEVLYRLSLLDVDYLVDVLGISSEEILSMFPDKVTQHIEEEYEIEQ